MIETDERNTDDAFLQQSESSSSIGCTAGDHFQQCEKSACMIILTKIKGLGNSRCFL